MSQRFPGRIAVADRGTCSFVQKARNVQAAGAIGLIVVNNVEGTSPIYLTGTDPTIRIPVVHVMLSDGNALKKTLAEFQKVAANLLADPEVRAGADRAGRPILFNPVPRAAGSTMSHWDPIAAPNQLMEPDIAVDLSHGVEPPNDLTLSLLKDLGWFSDFDGVPDGIDQCPGSDRRATRLHPRLRYPRSQHYLQHRMPDLRLLQVMRRSGGRLPGARRLCGLGQQATGAVRYGCVPSVEWDSRMRRSISPALGPRYLSHSVRDIEIQNL